MASNSRRQKRQYKESSTGKPIIALHKRKVVKAYQNEGGFYDGMPGVTLDSLGNRRIIDFKVTPEGDSNAHIFAHPQIAKRVIEKSMDHKELRSLILSAVVDRVFKNKWNVLYFFLRLAFRLKRWVNNYKIKRKQRKIAKIMSEADEKLPNE